MFNFLGHWLGLQNASGPIYSFWSGVFSDASILAVPFVLLRSRNCQVHRCWRLGRHPTDAGHRVCRKHHPDDHLTPQQVIDAHNAAGQSSD